MEHKIVPKLDLVGYDRFGLPVTKKVYDDEGNKLYDICGKTLTEKEQVNLDLFWNLCGEWYEKNTGIKQENFSKFSFKSSTISFVKNLGDF